MTGEPRKTFNRDTLAWCFSSLGIPQAGLPELVEIADRWRIPYLELRTLDNSLDLNAGLEACRRERPEWFAALAASGRIRSLDTSFGLAGAGPQPWDDLRRLAVWADRLGCPYLRVFGGFDFHCPDVDANLHRAAETLQRWQEIRAEDGLACTLAVETHDGLSSLERCRALRDLWGHRFPVIWDAHHTWREAGERFDQTFGLFDDGSIVHFHVKDSVVTSDGKHTSVLPGAGEVPMPELLATLRRVQFKGPVSLEWEKKWEPHLPELEEALRATAENWLP